MKTIIQLLIVALVVHASARGGMASWKYIKFKDAVEQEARFAGDETASVLKARILDLAAVHDVELDPADVEVHKDGTFTTVSAAYIEYIELVPRFYTREQLFEFEVSVHPVRPLTADDLR